MIKVNRNNNVITISGHACSDEYGKDIVCASTSSIIYTTINAIARIKENAIEVKDNKDMEIIIKTEDEIVLSLIENMLDLLKELQKDYPKNINVKER